MKRLFTLSFILVLAHFGFSQSYETQFRRSLHDLMGDVEHRFGVRFKYNVDTTGLALPYADFRVSSQTGCTR